MIRLCGILKRTSRARGNLQRAAKEYWTSQREFVTFTSTLVEANVTRINAMANGKFISYLRVSTARQGASGLGLEAQREAVSRYLNGGKWQLVQEVVEVESGKRNDRPAIAEALRLCRLHKATLIIAKLDRLARNVHFISSLMAEGQLETHEEHRGKGNACERHRAPAIRRQAARRLASGN
jgi:hypothetical protein